MEENKKQHPPRREGGRKGDHRQNDRHEGGQRISVRPGNFNPPAAPGSNAQQPAQPAAERRENNAPRGEGNRQNRHKNNRHRGNNRRGEQRANEQRNEQRSNTPAAETPDNDARNPQNNRQSQKNENRRDNRARDNRNRRDERRQQPAEQPVQAPEVSDTLRRELDEEFATTLLGSTTSLFRKDTKKEEEAVDSKEFEVDIATAAYLLDDIPCGFPVPDGNSVEVVGVRFRHAGKVYFFAPGAESFRIGESVLVDTARGPEIGEIVMLKRRIAEKDVIQPLRAVLRKATEQDKAHEKENHAKEAEALKICADKIARHKLDMKLVDAQYTFDNSKLLFYFTSEGRVDFRELVRDLAAVFHTRIELRQIGIRDESRLIGGLGMCGRPFCCSTFLSDFGQVSIKMAKEQGLSINTSKISGCCGRLMCCLRYEHETYAAEAKLTPKRDALVSTPDGNGVVVESTPLAGTVKVRLDSAPEEAPKVYHRDSVTVLQKEHRAPETAAESKSAAPENEDEA